MRFRPRTWFLLSMLLFAAAYWVWIYAEKVSATRRANAVRPAQAVPSQPLNPGTNLAKIAVKPKATDAKSYRLSNTKLTEKQLLRSDHAILLRNALIDTDRPLKLNIPEHLRAKGAPGSYIVQSEAALDQRFYDRLKKDGVTYVSYIPNNAALVLATPEQARQMASDAAFQAVLPYEPYYKLATALLPSAVAQDQPLSEPLNVTAMPGQRDAALAALQALGAQLMGEDPGPFGTTLSVMVPPEKLVAVAQLPLAQEIEAYTPRRTLNDLSRVIMNISSNTLYTSANYMNLTGLNVTVNMNDTGVDSTHPDFKGAGGTNGTRLLGAVAALTDQTTGHGTHVAGTIMGNGMESTTINSATNVIPGSVASAGFQGKATNALLYVQSIGIVSGATIDDAYQVGGSLISDSYLQTNASVNLGPTNLISNNSWGYEGIYTYDMHAASFDQATRDAQPDKSGEQPLVFVFAAGGEGNGNVYGEGGQAGTILSPATAKNVITVGALDEARYITNGVTFDGMSTNDIFFTWTDNDQYVAWFSSCGNIGPGTEGDYGRFKPDVVAPGVFTISCRATNYIDPTNAGYLTVYSYPNQQVLPGQTNDYPLAIPADTAELAIVITPNASSPTPFPSLDILGDATTPPPLTVLSTSGFVVLSNQLIAGEWYFGVTPQAGEKQPVAYDVTFYLVETNDLGVSTTNANGYYSVISNLNNVLKPYYVYEYGTSQAAGAVSGMLALMQQFMKTNTVLNVTNPSPALLKAMLINGSRSAEEQYDFSTQPLAPNEQGWGLPNLTNSLPSSLTHGGSPSMWVLDQSTNDALATGESQSFTIAPTDMNATNFPVRITLVWTDPPGDPTAGIALVNNLDLVVIDGTGTNVWVGNDFYTGDVFTEVNTGDQPDVINNVQNVYIDSAITPFQFPLYVSVLGMRVNVNAPTTVTNLIAQDYALVVSSDDTNAGIVSPIVLPPSYTPPASLTKLTATNTYTNASGGPLLAAPLLAFANSEYTLVTVLSNGVNYLHQRVGANEPNLYTNGVLYNGSTPPTSIPPLALGTNGNPYQWHFFVYSNNQYMVTNGSNIIATNFMVTTFLPPDLATQITPRTNGADLDLYVSTNSGLTNLDPNVFAQMPTNFMSLGRGGDETVIDTDSQMGEVYYIGVKSEDQQGADFGIYAVAQQQPFSTVNSDGSVTGTAGPLAIPDSDEGPPAILHIFLGPSPLNPQLTLRKITALLSISAENPSDYYGTLQSPAGVMDVLNNYSGPPGGFTNLYNDLNDNTTPGSVHSDGPGSLTSFINTSGLGSWMLTESDNALLQVGQVNSITLTAYPQPPQSGFLETLCGQQWFFDYVVVPDDATNMTISLTYESGTDQLGIFISPSNNVATTDYGTNINPPGGYVIYGPTNKPPLTGGVWYYGIYNYAQSSNDCDTFEVQVSFGLSQVPNLVQTYTNNTFVPLVTDGTTNASQICLSNGQSLIDLSVGVRLQDTNLDDLVLQLTSPQGTSIVLFENRGGVLANNLGLTLTNAASSNGASPNYIYTVFTEDSNLATVPIKFAPPPYAEPIVVPLTDLYSNNFDSSAVGNYTNGQTVAGWFVETNQLVTNNVLTNVVISQVFNEVSVANEPGFTLGITPPASNYLALASGRLSQTFTTTPGTAYEFVYYARSPGLTDWWPADDNLVDLIGTNNASIPYSDVTFGDGELDRAFSFSGVTAITPAYNGNEVDFGSDVGNFGTNDFTIDFWIEMPPNTPDWYGVLEKRAQCNGNVSGWWLRCGPTVYDPASKPGQLDFAVTDNNAVNINYWVGNKVINDGIFHHAALLRNGRTLAIYVDGILDSNITTTGIANIDNTVQFRAGQSICNPPGNPSGEDNADGLPFVGELDELDLWNRALSPAEIHAIYQAGSLGKYNTNSFYPNFQLVFDGVSTNDIVMPNFAETGWRLYTNSFIATSNRTTIELLGNSLGVLLDNLTLVRLPYTNYANYYLPEEPLAPLIGQNPQGCWTLSIWDTRTDSNLATNGALLSWTLEATTSSTNVDLIVLTNGEFYCTTNSPASGAFTYFAVDVPPTANFATNILTASGAVNLFFNQNALPTGTLPGDATLLTNAGTRTLSTQGAPPPLLPGQRYFLGVQNASATNQNFCLEVNFDVGNNTNITILTNGQSLDPYVTENQPMFYSFGVPTNAVMVTFQLLNLTNGEADLYARAGLPVPSPSYFDYASRNQATNDQFIVVTTNSKPVPLPVVNTNDIEPILPTTWYLSVYNPGTNPVGYTILATYVTNGPNGANGAMDIISLNNYTNYTYTNGMAQAGFPTNLLYSFTIPNTSLGEVEFVVTNISANGNLQLLVGDGAFPTPQDSYAGSFNSGTGNQTVVIVTNSALPTVSATWYLAVPNTSPNLVHYSITAIVTNGLLTKPLTWDGGAGSNWNFTEADWRPASGPPDITYTDTDPVTFDDTQTSGHYVINIPATVKPGGMTFNNSESSPYRFIGPGGIAGTNGLTDNGDLILDNSGSNTFSGLITLNYGILQIGNNDANGSITANVVLSNGYMTFNRTDNLTYAGTLSGTGVIDKSNTDILTLTGDNTNLEAGFSISDGTIRIGATNALGTSINQVIYGGGTLDLNSIGETNWITAFGAGMGSNGAVVNNGLGAGIPNLGGLLVGGATIGGLQSWNLFNPAGGAFLSTGGVPGNLTKVGTNVIGLIDCMVDSALSNIDVQAGTLLYQGTTDSLGNPTNMLTLETNATLEFYNATNTLNKVIVCKDSSTNLNAAGTNSISGPVVLSTNASGGPGTVTFNIGGTSQLLANTIIGTGNLIVTGGQPLYLSAANTYTGSTLVTTGTVFLINAGSIGLSSSVEIATNATIDATGRRDMTYTALSGQTLQGFGNINGLLSVASGATVAPGSSNLTGVLTVSSDVSLAGTAFFKINAANGLNDLLVSSNGTIAYGGLLEISNLNATALTNGQTIQIFSAVSNIYLGGFTNIAPDQPAAGLYWYTNLLTVNGTLVITNVPVSQSLTWDGGAGSNWNYTEPDWRSIFLPTDTTYSDTDPVTFDDSLTSGRNTINIIPNVQPGGITFSNSATNTYTFVGSGGITGITGINVESNGTVILDNSGSNTFTGLVAITNGTVQIGNNDTNGGFFANVLLAQATNAGPSNASSGTLIFNRSDNFIYGGVISGSGTLVQNDTNILTLAGNNTNLHGVADLLQGTLRLGAANALGSGSNVSILVSSNATLDLYSAPGTNFVTISGSGVGGGGAIVNNGIAPAVPGISYLTLTSNATLGGLQRWDLRSDITNDSGAQPTNYSFLSTGGHPYNLTKVGTNVIGLVNSSIDPALANIDVQAGTLNYEGATDSLGNPTNTLTIETNATLQLYNATNGLNKAVVCKDGSTIFNGAGTNGIFGPVTLSTNAAGGPGTATFAITGTSLLVSNRISGTGNLIVTGGRPLYLSTANTYSGFTLITNGELYLVNNGSIGFSPNVMISSNSTVNVSASGSTTYGYSGQTLQGFGNVLGRLSIPVGGIVAPGSSNATGALTVSSTVRLAGTAFFKVNNILGGTNDVLASETGVITYGGTLQISNMTANPFTNGESFQLFSAIYGYAGAFTNLVPATPGPGLTWDTNDLNVTGAISVMGIPPSPTTFTFINLTGTTLTFAGTNGIPNGTYVVLTSTNLAQPWTPLSTNTFNARGNFNFTETYNPSNEQQFFTIEQPY